MIVAWALLLVLAGFLVWRHRDDERPQELADRHGVLWFCAWLVAGFLMSFSVVTGFSIGLSILPAAAFALVWVARKCPRLPEASGFLVGIAATASLVAFLTA